MHAHSECPELAAPVWRAVAAAWERTTGERLDPTDALLTIMGLRPAPPLTFSTMLHGCSNETPSRYHCVAMNLRPPRTGQPECSVSPAASIVPLACL